MSNNFRVGQKVVCVCKQWRPEYPHLHPTLPSYGRVYTIRNIYSNAPYQDGAGLHLVEIVSKKGMLPCGTLHEVGFHANKFRPAVEKPCDISVFTKMLTPDREMV